MAYCEAIRAPSPKVHGFVSGAMSAMIPGLGQVYNGQVVKGLIVFSFSFLIIPYFYGIADAYFTAKRQADPALSAAPVTYLLPAAPVAAPQTIDMQLLSAAAERDGELTVTDGVMATGRPFAEVESTLDQMCSSGYVDIGNRPDSGVVVYRFNQLL